MKKFRAIFHRHKRALVILTIASVLDGVGGVLFALAQKISLWKGVYFAVTTATTVGYGDVTPSGWAAHVIAVVIMLTVIPLFAATYSLITTSLTTTHIDQKHDEMKEHVAEVIRTTSES